MDIVAQVAANAELLRLEKFGSAEALGRARRKAMDDFLADFQTGKRQGRYIAAELPRLPFLNKQFDLALCSHLLFLYSEQLSLSCHGQAISELCRIAREVRIYPLLDLANRPSEHLRQLLDQLAEAGHRAALETVPYEF